MTEQPSAVYLDRMRTRLARLRRVRLNRLEIDWVLAGVLTLGLELEAWLGGAAVRRAPCCCACSGASVTAAVAVRRLLPSERRSHRRFRRGAHLGSVGTAVARLLGHRLDLLHVRVGGLGHSAPFRLRPGGDHARDLRLGCRPGVTLERAAVRRDHARRDGARPPRRRRPRAPCPARRARARRRRARGGRGGAGADRARAARRDRAQRLDDGRAGRRRAPRARRRRASRRARCSRRSSRSAAAR